MKRILIADDNLSFNEKCCQFLTNEKYFVISVSNGNDALNLYLSEKPDALVLDLDMPSLNGINVVNTLSSIPSEINKCNVIIVSESKKLREQLLNTSKIFRIIPKPFNFEKLKDTLDELFNNHNSIISSTEDIKRLLLRLSFNLYSKGTQYLIDAIELCHDTPELVCKLNDIYSLIAKKNNTSTGIVKWSITNSLSAMNRYADNSLLYSIFDEYDGRKMSPKYFLTLVIEDMKLENKLMA